LLLKKETNITNTNKMVKPVIKWLESGYRRPAYDKRDLRFVKRIVVIGDLHGDFKQMIKVLKFARVVNSNNKWVAKPGTYIIQMGDIMDVGGRGFGTPSEWTDEVHIFQYLQSLDEQAPEDSGVIICIGNHEWTTTFSNDLDQKDYRKRFHLDDKKHAKAWGSQAQKDILWETGGLMARHIAKRCPLVLKIRNSLFAHGSVRPVRNLDDITYLNETARNILNGLSYTDKDRKRIESILWSRYLSTDTKGCGNVVYKLFKRLGMCVESSSAVVGHQIMKSKTVEMKCDDLVAAVDVGMSQGFNPSHVSNIAYLQLDFINNKITKKETRALIADRNLRVLHTKRYTNRTMTFNENKIVYKNHYL
jgi:hypothetical protein